MGNRLLVLACFMILGVFLAFPVLAVEEESVRLTGHNQQEIGTVTMAYVPNGLLVTVEVSGMSEGWHGFHIHEKGDCSDEKFEMAGPHASGNAEDKHGFHNEGQNHWGDLPNIWVNETGTGKAQFFSARITREGLNDNDGSAFILHDTADDYVTDPSGQSGSRVACAVIAPPKP